MTDINDTITEPVSLQGIDPLDTASVKTALAAIARDHLVVIEQLEELDASAQVQVKIHAANALAVTAAREALANPVMSASTAALEKRDARGVRDVQDAYSASMAPRNEDTSAVIDVGDGSRRHPRWSCEGCPDCVSEVPPA